MTISMTRRMFLGGAAAALVPFIGFQTSKAIAKQPAAPDRPVLLTNLRLFDGASGTVREGVNILVEGNQITALPSVTEPIENARVIDCGGRLAMPGLIDAHWHSMFCGLTEMAAMTADLGYVYLVAAREAENTLLRGFTSVREQPMLGASQIKLMAGGGVSSHYDPLDSTQYSETELRAAVGAAEDWGTYVMVHVYTSRGIQRAIRAGVRSIEHGQLADQDAAKLMADEGVWWSLQPFLADEDANVKANLAGQAKQREVAEGTLRAYEMAIDLKIKTAWGTDILFTPQNLSTHGHQLAKLTRFYHPLPLLQIATAKNGELLRIAGNRSPYDGKLGVIEPGGLADILIADGDPTVSLDFLSDPDTNLRLIMKDGRIYKDRL